MYFRLLVLTLCSLLLGGFATPVLARMCYPVTVNLGPYLGFDLELRDMGFKQGYGDKVFEKQYPQANLFVGLMFNEFFGIELGYEKTLKRSRNSSFTGGDVVLGNIATSGTSGKFQSHGELYGPNINFMGVYKPCEAYPLEIFGSIGGSYLTAKFDRNLFEFNDGPASLLRTFEQDKALWRIAIGLQYVIADCIGVRTSLKWENTSQMRLYTRELLANPPQIKLKDSLIFGLGFYYIL